VTRLFSFRGSAALVALLCLWGCEAAKSANPTAPTVAGPIAGVNISAPHLLEPYTGSTLIATGEPQTLLIENASTSGVRTLYLQVEIGTDSQFQQIVYRADQIELGDNGRTRYQLPSPLGASQTYYWRTRAVDGANTGPFSEVSSFAVIPPAVINPPVAIAPSGKLSSNRPDFKVTNGAISGTSGVAYRFEVSKSADFGQVAAVVTVPVNGGGTTTMSLGELPYKATYFWRVMGSDGAKESGYSNVMSFTTSDPPVVAPPPTGGFVDTSSWTTEQWKTYFFFLVEQKGGGSVSDAGMWAMRADLNARGADFQNAWRGDIRPRLFLPVPGCPSTTNANAPGCSYNRTVDLGNYGGGWQWIPRF
jgi:hypothetical protein